MTTSTLPPADRSLVVATLWLRVEALKARLRDPAEHAERHLIMDEVATLRRIANTMSGAVVTITETGHHVT